MVHDDAVLEIVSEPPPSQYAEVLGRLSALDRELPSQDGLCWFNRLYHAMTEAVVDRARTRPFRDPTFLEEVLCQFAALYFEAVRVFLEGVAPAPGAWRPLFEARERRDIAPLQFAVAGVNAHINRDLCVALAGSLARLGGGAESAGRLADYREINPILEEVQGREKDWLVTGALAGFDHALGRHDDVWTAWSLTRARDNAWINGQLRYHLRSSTFLCQQHLHSLDRLVGLAGRGLLRPLPV
jgi:hypothetical protein